MAPVEEGRLLAVGNCTWNPASKVLEVRGSRAKLSWKAQECWTLLVEAGGEVVTRETIHKRIWGDAVMEESNLAHVLVSIRKAIDPAPEGGSHIETIPRVGYRLSVPVTIVPAEPAPAAEVSALRQRPRMGFVARAAVAFAIVAAAVVLGNSIYHERRKIDEATRLSRTAMSLSRKGTMSAWGEARQLIDQALAIDPDFPLAKAASAELAVRAGARAFDAALALAREAVAADPSCGDCHAVLGYILLTRFWNWEEAEKQLVFAATQDAPAATHVWYAQLLGITNRFEAALRQADLAIQKDRNLASAHVMKGVLYYLQNRIPEAEAQFGVADGIDPNNPNPPFWLYRCMLLRDKPLDAGIAWAKHGAVHANFSFDMDKRMRDQIHQLYEGGGKAAIVNRWLKETTEIEAGRQHSYERAVWKMWLGDRAGALDELEKAEKARPFNLIYVAVDPALAPLRSESRFKALVTRLHLPVVE